MSRNFNITAQLQMRGPNNIRQVVNQIRQQLGTVSANVNVNIASGTNTRLNTLNANLNRINATLINIQTNAGNAAAQLQAIGNSLSAIRAGNLNITIKQVNNLSRAAAAAGGQIEQFGEQAGLAVRRFVAFAVPTSIFFGLVAAIKEGVAESIEFEKEMIRLSQVTGKSVAALSDLSGEITRLATGLGVSSKELGNVATTLAQAGLSAKETKLALEALARSSLAATFTSIEDTTEGAIATFQQFGVRAQDLQGVIGSLNAVSAQFAVESDDLVSVIRRTGGAFKAAGGDLNELLGLFTSVRATTRESADSIATGFRTIFTRIQRPRTIQFLKELGIELSDVNNKFVGPTEAVRRINAAMSQIEGNDPRFAAIVEELGGFRQVSKVIPLIQQFPEALKAIQVAQEGQLSIVEDSEVAQKSLANQITKVREEFLALFKELTSDKSFRAFVDTSLDLAKALIEVTRTLKPLLPLLGGLAIVQGVRSASAFGSGLLAGLGGNASPAIPGRRRFAKGGLVPGSGNGDTVPALLTPGEFVLKKSAVKALGMERVAKLNKFAQGGPVKQFGIASLFPSGQTPYSDVVSYQVPGSKKKINQQIEVFPGSLTQGFAEQQERTIQHAVSKIAVDMGRSIEKQLGATEGNIGNIDRILKKSNFFGIVGSIFESSLALAGAPYNDKGSNNAPIDFPKGLGSLAEKFGLPSNIPTDATRIYKSKAKFRGQVERHLKALAAMTVKPNVANSPALGSSRLDAITGTVLGQLSGKRKEAGPAKGAIKELRNVLEARIAGTRREVKPSLKSFGYTADDFKIEGLSEAEVAAKQAEFKALLQKVSKNVVGFAKGGMADGTDTVPAMLTPGEFVINKDSARKIGIGNLNNLNNIQKFARGGQVGNFAANRGSSLSGATGFSLLGSGALSLVGTMDNLDDSTKKVIETLVSFGISLSTLSFLIKSSASDARLLTLSRGGLGSNRSAITKTLARNFDAVSTGLSAFAAAAAIAGSKLQELALTSAKGANSQEELNKAISTDKQGSILTGTGTGAGLGAAIGTAIAPGIGTAIGAAVGALAGAIAGTFTANTDDLIKAFKQAQFDKVADRLDTLFDDIGAGRLERNAATGVQLNQQLRTQLKNISQAGDLEQRREFTKQLKSSITNVRDFAATISAQSDSIEEFERAFGGTGKTLIDTITTLTNKTYPEVREQIEKEIKARVSAAAAQSKVKSLEKNLTQVTTSLSVFANSLLIANTAFSELTPLIDTIIAGAEGGFAPGKFTGVSGVTSGIFSAAAEGKANETDLINSIRTVTAGLDAESRERIELDTVSIARLTKALPSALSRTAARTGLTGSGEQAALAFESEIDAIQGVSKSLKDLVKARFETELASRESSGEAGFLASFRADPGQILDKLLNENDKKTFKELEEVAKGIAEQSNIIADRLAARTKLELDIAKKRVDIESKKLEFEKNLLKEGETLSLSRVQGAFNAQQATLLSGTGVDNNVDAISSALRASLKDLFSTQNALQNAGGNDIPKFEKELDALNLRVGRLRSALEGLANSTLVLSKVQDDLAKEEENRKARTNLVDNLIFGEGKDRVQFARSANALSAINRGETNVAALPNEIRKAVLNLVGSLPQDAGSGLLGGLTPRKFLEAQRKIALETRAGREGVDAKVAADIFSSITDGTKDELNLRAKLVELQTQQLDAQNELANIASEQKDELDNINSKSLENLGTRITNAIIEARVSSLNSDLVSAEADKLNFDAQVKSLNNLESIFGTNANQAVKDAKRAVAFSSEINAVRQARDRIGQLDSLDASKLISRASTNISAKAEFSTLGTLFGTDQPFGGGRASAQIAELASAFNTTLSESEIADLQSKLNESLSQLNVTLSDDVKKGTFAPNTFVAPTGDIVTNKNSFKVSDDTGVTKLIEDRINKTVKTFIEGLRKPLVDDAVANENRLRGAFGDEIAKKLTGKGVLGDVTTSLDSLGNEFKNGTDIVSLYHKKLAQFTKQIESLTNEINNAKGQIKPIIPESKAKGGLVGGRGVGAGFVSFQKIGTDSVPTMLTPGEFVVNRAAAQANLPLLESLNMAKGGKVALTKEQIQANVIARAQARARGRGSNVARRMAILNLQNKKQTENRENSEDKVLARTFIANISKKAGITPLNLKGGGAREFFADNLARVKRNAAADARLWASEAEDRKSINATRMALARITFAGDTSRAKDAAASGRDFFAAEKERIRAKFPILRRAAGGPVPGSGNSDNVPALLTPGEFVLNRRATKALGLNSLSSFNKRFARGGPVTGGGTTTGGINLSPDAMSALVGFNRDFGGAIGKLNSAIGTFNQVSSALSTALSNWNSNANKLAEAMLSMPTEIQINHSAIAVNVNVTGMEGLQKTIIDNVMAQVDKRLSAQTAKAADGTSPFFSGK